MLKTPAIGSELKLLSKSTSTATISWCVVFLEPYLKFVENQDAASDDLRDEIAPEYALDLSVSEINGDLILQPNVTVDGGINIRGIHIRGDFSANGAHLKSRSEGRYALCAQSAIVNGIVSLSCLRRGKSIDRFIAEGSITFNCATLETLLMDGALIKCDNNEGSHCYLQAGNCEIKESVSAHKWPSNPDSFATAIPFETENVMVAFSWSSIGGYVDMEGAKLSASPYSFVAYNARINGNLTLTAMQGSVYIRSANVDCALRIGDANLSDLYADGVVVGGDVSLYGEIHGKASFRGACIDGECRLGGVNGPPLIMVETADVVSEVSLEDARISRELRVNEIQVVSLQDDNKRAVVNLRGLKVDAIDDNNGYQWGEAVLLIEVYCQ